MAIPQVPNFWPMALGSNADTVEIPDTTPAGEGIPSFTSLFPVLTQIDPTAGGVFIERSWMNGLFQLLGNNIWYLQHGSPYPWSATLDYPVGAVVQGANGVIYRSLTASGPSISGVGPLNPINSPVAWTSVSPIITANTQTPRTAEARAGDIVNVKDYGAIGNGIADDTTAIQMATQTAIEKKCGVFFPAGRYIASSVYQQSLLYGDGVLVLSGSDIVLPSCVSLQEDVKNLSASSEDQAAQIAELQETKADKSEVTTPFNFKGETTFASLPPTGSMGDTYFVTDKGYNMSWTGSGWAQSSADLSGLSAAITNCVQGFADIITADNMQELCGGDIDNLTINRVYAIQNGAGVASLPEENIGGLYVPLGRITEPRGATSAIFITFSQNFYMRLFAADQWQPWQRLVNASEFSYAVTGNSEIVTAENMIAICNGDAQKLQPEKIYIIAAGTGMLNLPEDSGGSLFMYNRGPFLSTGATALFVTLTGNMYYMNRPNSSGVWSAWHRVADDTFLAPYLHGETVIATTNSEEICQNDLGNLPSQTIYTVSSGNSALAGTPVPGDGGLIAVLSRNALNASGSARLFNSFTNDLSHATRVGTSWGKWKRCVSHDIPKVLALGDSICYGYRNGGAGFVGGLNLESLNVGVSGARLSSTATATDPIFSQLANIGDFSPDIIIFDGGINDYNNAVPLGTLPESPTDTTITDTLLGGMQHLLYQMKIMYPFCQLYFIAVHKMKISGQVYAPTTQNAAGYTQTDMTEEQKKLCRMFGVSVVDVFNESPLDTSFSAYLGDVGSDAWCDNDGVHPLNQGYLNAYIPLIKKAIMKSNFHHQMMN